MLGQAKRRFRTIRFAIGPAMARSARDDNNRETIFMNQNVNELIKARVHQWNKAAAVLQDVRNHDIQLADTARAMHCFTGAVLAALPKHPPLPWSGLVEQQKIFRKVRVL